jgi:hypothetical protein
LMPHDPHRMWHQMMPHREQQGAARESPREPPHQVKKEPGP